MGLTMGVSSYPASTSSVAFDCPHCGTYTSQEWFTLYARGRPDDSKTPHFPGPEFRLVVQSDSNLDAGTKKNLLDWIDGSQSGLVFFERLSDSTYSSLEACNLNLSRCFACRKLAVWVHKSLAFPPPRDADSANTDLPAEIISDFNEARSIVNLSPRGASALLRLCVQKLCIHLGEKGKKIDDDIASLVSKGLNPLVQKSLDIVRVIGNEAVHPGTIDMRDDRDTALKLFSLVNIVAEQMISHPKSVDALYSALPEAKRVGIDNRDKK
jgi:Domain of unknown function (DUF4145)